MNPQDPQGEEEHPNLQNLRGREAPGLRELVGLRELELVGLRELVSSGAGAGSSSLFFAFFAVAVPPPKAKLFPKTIVGELPLSMVRKYTFAPALTASWAIWSISTVTFFTSFLQVVVTFLSRG